MILTETTSIPDTALPVAELSAHLRIGTGFAEDGLQDGVLVAYLRAALATIEAQTGITLLSRDFRWDVTAFRDCDQIDLPLRPVSAVLTIGVFDAAGTETVIDVTEFRLRSSISASVLLGNVPSIPTDGSAEIEVTAGFATWAEIPQDLAHAVLLLAAWFYENRTGSGGMPTAVKSILANYKSRRLSIGGSV
ncbi:MAG: hypothetical protein AAFR98_10765 [Pseudomonadota bacterium]